MPAKRTVPCLLLLALQMVTPAGPGVAQPPAQSHRQLQTLDSNPTLPAAWAGIWSVTTMRYDCEDSTLIATFTELDTLCTGDYFPYPAVLFPYCHGTIDSTSIDVSCADCTETRCAYYIYTFARCTRSGDTFSGTGMNDYFYSCPAPEYGCYNDVYNAVRIGPEPLDCLGVAVEPTTWGRIKAQHP